MAKLFKTKKKKKEYINKIHKFIYNQKFRLLVYLILIPCNII